MSFDRCRFSVILLFFPDFGGTKYRGYGMHTYHLPHDFGAWFWKDTSGLISHDFKGVFSYRRFDYTCDQ